jgi:(p)ppGpp synthase/HD superfamily hydrolase
MDLIEEARSYGYMAHYYDSPTRYKGLPAFTHPAAVAEILERHGCKPEVIAAGFLHDVTEDTKIKISEIYKLFGSKVAYLVFTASERSTSERKVKGLWIPRKEIQVFRTHYLPIDNKYVIGADKKHNISRLIEEFKEKGREDWSLYNEGREGQLLPSGNPHGQRQPLAFATVEG